MDNKKFEQLIDLIINENEEQARALFHDIVVEKSREIYESMMDDEEEGTVEESAEGEEAVEEGIEMGGDQVGSLMDEIGAEEEGLGEEEDEFADIEVDDEEGLGAEGGEEDLEDRVVDLEDKLDELMAEFEEMMSGEEGGEEDFGGEEEFGGEEDLGGEEEFGGEEELAEAVQLQKVSVTHGDNGQNTKSPVSGGSKVSANGAKAVAAGFQDSGKGGTQGGLLNPATKDLPGAGKFKNAPGKGNFSEKGEAAPKPKHGDDGQNTKSIVGESRKTTKKIVK